MSELSFGNLLWIFTSAAVVNNFTLYYFLGLCPFLGVSGRIDTALRMGMANIFVMTVTSMCAWFLKNYVLVYASYLQLIAFIVVIASTVQFVEMVIKKLSPALFRALGIFLPLITTNCAILYLALTQTKNDSRGERAGVAARGAERGGHELPHRRDSQHGLHGLCRAVQQCVAAEPARDLRDRGAGAGRGLRGVGRAAALGGDPGQLPVARPPLRLRRLHPARCPVSERSGSAGDVRAEDHRARVSRSQERPWRVSQVGSGAGRCSRMAARFVEGIR
jgi:electron transport complex protein RnfA